MKTWIALFRGINVGGNNILPMAKLRADLESLNLTGVRTYIQSGNAVFESSIGTASSLAKKIQCCIEERHGFRPLVFILSCRDLQAAVEANPFVDAVQDPRSIHFFFLAGRSAEPNRKRMQEARSATEKYELTDRVFYLFAPDGIGRSKLAANVEKYLGVAATARNYRTVEKLLAMAMRP
jgi:uncharacterized protein (DUF1697 family)